MSEISKASILLPSLGFFNDMTLVYNTALSERENLPLPLQFLGFFDSFIKIASGLNIFSFRVPKVRPLFTNISEN